MEGYLSKSLAWFYSPYVPGWDCHGLPIEHKVDQQLGSRKKSMSQIEVRDECRKYAEKYLDDHCRLELTAYTFILGGALGNIIDRLRLGFVVDFLDAYIKSHHRPTFNCADSFISIGVLLLAWSIWRGKCIQY